MLSFIVLSIASVTLLGVGAVVPGMFALAVMGLALTILTAAWGLTVRESSHARHPASARLHHG